MSSRASANKNSNGVSGSSRASKGKQVEGSPTSDNNARIQQLSQGVATMNMENEQDGGWELPKKSKNKGGNPPKQWPAPTNGSKTWAPAEKSGQGRGKTIVEASGPGTPGGRTGLQNQPGKGSYNSKSQGNNNWESAYMTPNHSVVPPPLQNGWQWAARNGPNSRQKDSYNPDSDKVEEKPEEESGGDDDDDDDDFVDSDDDVSDEYDSDASQKSFETRKRNKWFKAFFEALDSLSVEEINEPTRQWHCPACQRGPGAIDWYRGLQPLITHAKTKGSKRVKLHRELAELLEEEVQRKGTGVVPIGEVFGKWKGLSDKTPDVEIVWPPMVVIMNTILEKDDNDKWIGMGNQELLDYFKSYEAVKARHSYGPQGHRGISLLIFEATAIGYIEAQRLHDHFIDEGTDRDAWERRQKLFYPGGQRQLHGFLATKEDIDCFNVHSHGKTRQKFEMRSRHEMVDLPLKKMNADNQQLMWYKNKAAKQQQRSKTLEESLGMFSQRLRQTNEENKMVRLRSKEQHEENKAEMDQQDRFFKEQMDKIHKAIEDKDKIFEKLLQDERTRAKQGLQKEQGPRREDLLRLINGQENEAAEFHLEREKLERAHEERKAAMRKRHLEEEVSLEKEFEQALTTLRGNYVPVGMKAGSEL
ncbi:XS domain-containing protein / XS zinc finger domain-containing protein-like protein [Wolffia australiana]